MKKNIAYIMAAALMLTGCQSTDIAAPGAEGSDTSGTGIVTDISGITLEPETEEFPTLETNEMTDSCEVVSSPATAEVPCTIDTVEAAGAIFKPGTWRGANSYYFFDRDGKSGSTLGFELGIGVGFRYEADAQSAVFHMGAADNNSVAAVSCASEDEVTLTWENGTAETLVYVSPLSSDEFVFYCDEQIAQIALSYYQANYDYTPGSVGIQSNDDGTVTIQLYDNMGDHNATSGWYTIDRVTLTGTDDMSGESVDMSAYAGQ